MPCSGAKTTTNTISVTLALHWGKQLKEDCRIYIEYIYICMYTVEPPIMDTQKNGQRPYNGQTVHPCLLLSIHFTSKEGTTSEQWTKCSSTMCPLIRELINYMRKKIKWHFLVCPLNSEVSCTEKTHLQRSKVNH